MYIRNKVCTSQKWNLAQLLQSTRLCIATDLTPDTIQRYKKQKKASISLQVSKETET